MAYLARRGGLRAAQESIAAAQSASSAQDRAICGAAMDAAHRAIARHMARAPLFWLLVIPAVLALAGVITSSKATRLFRAQLDALDASAYGEGAMA
jgi:hypothetical protein